MRALHLISTQKGTLPINLVVWLSAMFLLGLVSLGPCTLFIHGAAAIEGAAGDSVAA